MKPRKLKVLPLASTAAFLLKNPSGRSADPAGTTVAGPPALVLAKLLRVILWQHRWGQSLLLRSGDCAAPVRKEMSEKPGSGEFHMVAVVVGCSGGSTARDY